MKNGKVGNLKDLEPLTKQFFLEGCCDWQGGFRLLAAVGRQPSELAVKIQTLKRLKIRIDEVRLLRTQDTRDVAERLEHWLRSRLPQIRSLEIVEIPNRVPFQEEIAAIQTWCRQSKEHYEGPILVSADPGQASTLAVMVRDLRGTETTFLHSDLGRLFACRARESGEFFVATDLENLGIESLLELYAVVPAKVHPPTRERRMEVARFAGVDPSTLPDALGLRCGDSNLHIDMAYERRGRLFGLNVFDDDRTTKQRKEAIRNYASHKTHQALNGLRPELAGFSRDRFSRGHLRSHACVAFGKNTDRGRLKLWLSRSPEPPGRNQRPHSLETKHSGSKTSSAGKTLIVAMGTEPASTLTSIQSHQPSGVRLICDTGTPDVMELARRLDLLNRQLKVKVTVVPSDMLGHGLLEWWGEEGRHLPNPVVDVTPGSKMQTRVLAQFDGAQIWCLRGDKACSLTTDSTRPADQATLDLIATMRTGKRPSFRTNDPTQVGFYSTFKDLVTCLQSSGRLEWQQLYDGATVCPCKGNISIIRGGVRVTHRGVTQTLLTKQPPKPGQLFEVLLAYQLANHVARVVHGVKWRWSDEFSRPRSDHQIELDVAFTDGPSTFAISCKTGKDDLGKSRREIESVATLAFGRSYRTIPVLIHPKIKDHQMHASRDAPSGAVLIPLRLAVGPEQLLRELRRAAMERRKFT